MHLICIFTAALWLECGLVAVPAVEHACTVLLVDEAPTHAIVVLPFTQAGRHLVAAVVVCAVKRERCTRQGGILCNPDVWRDALRQDVVFARS